jgi:hypothetical protein
MGDILSTKYQKNQMGALEGKFNAKAELFSLETAEKRPSISLSNDDQTF